VSVEDLTAAAARELERAVAGEVDPTAAARKAHILLDLARWAEKEERK
jgi:hypothetical protein